MRRRLRLHLESTTPVAGAVGVSVLPSLATVEQVAAVLQVSARTLHYWRKAGKIPTAVECGKVVRLHPPSVAAALGIKLPEFGTAEGGAPQNLSQ